VSQGPGYELHDAHWMRRALGLARPYLAAAWPNPTVGAVVVRDGEWIGEGVHLGPGREHAEVAALRAAREAGRDPVGSTVYVTLEPCHHRGRTPPCSKALVEAGVARVVYAVADENPRTAGGGSEYLRELGVEICGGCMSGLAFELNHPFFETRADDEVHWTLKLALGLDGTIAPARVDLLDPEARRITGALAHRRAHRLRAGARSVLVGSATARLDQPRLDIRHLPEGARVGGGPRPVVLDSGASLAPDELPSGALVLHSDAASVTPPGGGREWAATRARPDGRLDWGEIARALVARDLGLVLVEGGASVAEDLVREVRPQRIHLFVAPRSWDHDSTRVALAVDLDRDYRRVRVRRLGADLEWVFQRRDLPEDPTSVRDRPSGEE
jgi:diaminohydroxyphosphoribosylaminopyrimidine deaminase / 5-amino-6-(5-phosphoribosylamino)uracil reductase